VPLAVTGVQYNAACPPCSLPRRVTAVAILLLVMGTESALAATLSEPNFAPFGL
jgi:hypothetical protein